MNWLVSGWRPVWRRHPWVFTPWLLGVVATLVATVSIPIAGWDSLVFWSGLFWGIVLQTFHEWVVKHYERREAI